MSLITKRQLVSLIFPATCIGCSQEIEPTSRDDSNSLEMEAPISFLSWQNSHWCDGCWMELSDRSKPRCNKCGATLFQPAPFEDRCKLCHGFDLRFEQAIAVGNYQGLLQDLIIRMKSQHDEALAVQLGHLLSFELMVAAVGEFDFVVAVPTHWWRKLKRGFHAAEVLCESVSERTGITRFPGLVKTVRHTKKQGTLSTHGRFANVRGAFAVRAKARLAGRRILLIDDVMTSGATTSEVARMLLRRGAASVSVAVVARGARVS